MERWSQFAKARKEIYSPSLGPASPLHTRAHDQYPGPHQALRDQSSALVPLPEPQKEPAAPAAHLGVGFGQLQGAGVAQLVPEEAEGADAAAVLAAEELEELVVLRALALLQVAQGRAELVVAEGPALLVRPQVLFAEGRGAGEAGPHGGCLQAGVAEHGARFLLLLLLLFLGAGAALELLHHPAQHRVLLQLRAVHEGSPALRAAEVLRHPGPGALQAGGAEVVPARHGHGAAEEAEADGAGQFLLKH